ncbi:MAG: sugar transferase [bacterium]|nr:sugar transferase [bacterium]
MSLDKFRDEFEIPENYFPNLPVKEYFGKRILDFLLTMIALFFALPVMGIIAILVAWKMGRPILFCQKRPGLLGKGFWMFKFRTMNSKRDAEGKLLPDGERLTPLGIWLRRTSLDELPELLNILKGDMSIVGPRPLLFRYMPYFTTEERKRFLVRPGLTGLAQISGRNLLNWDKRLACDVEYYEKQSLFLDLKIIFLTFKKFLIREGVSPNVDEVETWLDEERKDQKQV